MNINNTSEVLIEIGDILKAITSIDYIGIDESTLPLAQETNNISSYIQLVKTIPRLERQGPEIDSYDFTGLFLITINVDTSSDKYLLFNTMDLVKRAVLNDEGLWNKLVDRDIVSIEYDNGEFSPKRTASCVLQARYRLTCI